jgi:hypothetical protein
MSSGQLSAPLANEDYTLSDDSDKTEEIVLAHGMWGSAIMHACPVNANDPLYLPI